MAQRRRAWSGQGYLPLNTIHDFGSKHTAQCYRLTHGDSRLLCVSLGEPHDPTPSCDDDEDDTPALHVLPWMLHALNIPNGGSVTYECIASLSIVPIAVLEVELLHPFPRSSMVATKKRHDIPQVVRDGTLDFSTVIRRQLTHAARDHVFSVRLMGQLYIGRVVQTLDGAQHHIADVGAVTSTTTVLHRATSATTSLVDDWKVHWDAFPWRARMQAAGFAGYDSLVDHMTLHLRLVLSMEQAAITSHGLLVHGVRGVGKTLFLHALETQLTALRVPCLVVDGLSLQLEADTTTAFASASTFLANRVRGLAPHGVLLVDNLDALFDDEDGGNEMSSLGRSLLQLLDAWATDLRPLAMVATTTSTLPPTALRAGRLERQFKMDVPTESMRQEILACMLPNQVALVHRLASITGGYVGKDLAKIVRHATAATKLKHMASSSPSWLDLLHAQGNVQPSQLQDLNVQRPSKVETWQKFAGYAALKTRLVELISYRFERKDALQGLGVDSVSGILLYGPSGCGKSMLIRGLAAASNANFVHVQSSKLMSKYFGETEKSIRDLFARAQSSAPCILFFDELDSIAEKRAFSNDGDSGGASGVYSRVLSTLLNEMDGIGGQSSDVIVMAATNRVDSLDAALVRPGRMDQALEVGYPSAADREAIFAQYTNAMPLAADMDVAALAAMGHDCMTGAEIGAICKEAAFRALRESEAATHVEQRHFREAMAVATAKKSAAAVP
ncbi:Aste57867_15434 [Aphanomyces stellatus]|uniref:Aste57867_15434 protein n=1 Tax=Aphanomyces stellatus TaxID=120398 RepID=A0A485L3P2_9STRA|nr:hypothetical protein As57867_015378 [Aphanomyces stellatus]VFT92236.1 Aste57867_15434 [Aphanomyces stellatus]